MRIDLLLNFSPMASDIIKKRTGAFDTVGEVEYYSALKRQFWHLPWHGLILKVSCPGKYPLTRKQIQYEPT